MLTVCPVCEIIRYRQRLSTTVLKLVRKMSFDLRQEIEVAELSQFRASFQVYDPFTGHFSSKRKIMDFYAEFRSIHYSLTKKFNFYFFIRNISSISVII